LGGARRGVRTAALAGPEARSLRAGGAAVEAHVGPLRRDGRTARPAIDAGRGDAQVDPAVEAVVAALDRAVPVFLRPLHTRSMPRRLAEIGQHDQDRLSAPNEPCVRSGEPGSPEGNAPSARKRSWQRASAAGSSATPNPGPSG